MEIEKGPETEVGTGNEETAVAPLRKTLMVAAIAAGIQFGWALQLSLLTPYVQLLGVPHQWSSFIWLCGPVSGLLVQPICGYYSDRCTSRFGRRRPFIAAGAACVAISVILISFAADIGYQLGDSLEAKSKPRAVAFFVVGFWILDVANNMLQGPCRAFLADLSNRDARRTSAAYAFYSFFMAVGNVLGYAAGSYSDLYHLLPFAKTEACNLYCANLKTCFILSICLLLFVSILAITCVKEKPFTRDDSESNQKGGIREMIDALKHLKKPMRILFCVTVLNWIAWFPFFLFDTDWMGKEVYGGKTDGTDAQTSMYNKGVHAGSLGLLLNSVVLGVVSLGIEALSRRPGDINTLWGLVNFILAACLALTVPVTKMATRHRRYDADKNPLTPHKGITAGALTLFSVLGIPLAVTYSVPFALTSIFSVDAGAGQGLSLGLLNLAIVVPQMFVSFLSGPWDALFGGGNLPAFVVGAVSAAASGICALTWLPKPSNEAVEKAKGSMLAGGGH